MPTSKRRLAHLKNARLASVAHFKKQKLEQAHRFSTEQSRIDDNELSTSDTGNTGDTDVDTDADTDEEGTWFWNKSANESESDSECSGDSEEEGDLAPEGSRTEQEAPSQEQPKEIKWNKEGEENLRGVYGQGSVATFYRKKKAASKWEEEGRKSYNIQALWQRNRDRGLISTNTQSEPSEASDPSSYPLNKVPPGCEISRSKQEVDQEKRTTALKDITRLLELVTVQEEKYGERLSPHGNFHRRHMMVQQFLQIQLRSKTSQRRRDLSLSIARSFGKGHGTARNIVRWENSWVKEREIPGRKNRDDYFSWMNNEDVQESLRDYARKQGDRLTSYKLVQHLRDYVNPEGIQTPIEIKSRTARKWLHKLGFEYKDIKKDVFVDGHERPDVVEDRQKFLRIMKDLEPYLVEFEEDGSMKTKNYPDDCAVGGNIRQPVIVITHDECTFSANDGIRRAWTRVGDTFLRPKGRGQGIMVSDFLLPFGRLNLSSLSEGKKKEVIDKTGLSVTEAVELFEYGKTNGGYWDGSKLHKQVVNKALPIAEALYPGYSLLFLFDNATSHSVYAQNALRTAQMNKGIGGQQPWLRDGWYEKDGARIIQPMSFQKEDGTWCQKGVRQVLEERQLWPQQGLKLECPKPKCFNCEVINVIHARHQKITVLLAVQKLENVMHVHIESQFVNVSQKNTVQFVQLKRGNVLIVKIYPLNALPIVVVLEHYYLFNRIFKDKNAKLKNLFKILHKVNITLSFTILNFTANSTILSIFGIQLNNTLNIGVNIHLTIFGNVFLYHWKMSQITLAWPIIIGVAVRWSFIEKALHMVQVLGKLAQHIKNQQTVMKIVDIAEYEALLWRWLATKR